MTLLLSCFVTSVNWCPDEFMVSIVSFKSSSIRHDVDLVNYISIKSKIEAKVSYLEARILQVMNFFLFSYLTLLEIS